MITFVTGGTGFVGWYVVRRLLTAGHHLRVLAQPHQAVPPDWRDRVEVVRGDLTEPCPLTDWLTGVSTVVHLAGEVRRAERFDAVNVAGTRQLLAGCAAAGNLRVVHLSSVGVIGAQRPGLYTEVSACQPRNAYERSKYQGEQIALDYARQEDLRLTVLRPTIVFGPRTEGPADSFLAWLRAIQRGRFRFIGSGSGAANYVYVDDVAAACVGVIDRPETIGHIYHVADPTTIGELIAHMAHTLRVPLPRSLPVPMAYAAALTFEVASRVLRRPMPLTLARLHALTSRIVYSGDKLRAIMPLSVGWRAGVTRTIDGYRQAGQL